MKKDFFPIFQKPQFKETPLIYLDSAATTQKPAILSQSLAYFYENLNSNIGRSSYNLAYLADTSYENSRKIIAQFLNISEQNITFTSGATHSLNLVSHIVKEFIPNGSKIILGIFEHHANLLPWQQLAKEKNLSLVYLEDEDLNSPEKMNDEFWDGVSFISLTHVTNTTGQVIPVEKWISIAKSKNIITSIDGSQAICSLPVNLKSLDTDFYSFSAHKLYGPMGLGILYMNTRFIKATPLFLGGGIIEDVEKDNFSLIEDIKKFEAGTPNVANIYAFSQVLTWLIENGWIEELGKLEKLSQLLEQKLLALEFIDPIYIKNELKKSHIFSFNIKGVHAHDVSTFFDKKNICVRTGKHCAYPLHNYLGVSSSIRVSLGIYNDEKDIDFLVKKVTECHDFFYGLKRR